jgi:hypothetical protein
MDDKHQENDNDTVEERESVLQSLSQIFHMFLSIGKSLNTRNKCMGSSGLICGQCIVSRITHMIYDTFACD